MKTTLTYLPKIATRLHLDPNGRITTTTAVVTRRASSASVHPFDRGMSGRLMSAAPAWEIEAPLGALIFVHEPPAEGQLVGYLKLLRDGETVDFASDQVDELITYGEAKFGHHTVPQVLWDEAVKALKGGGNRDEK